MEAAGLGIGSGGIEDFLGRARDVRGSGEGDLGDGESAFDLAECYGRVRFDLGVGQARTAKLRAERHREAACVSRCDKALPEWCRFRRLQNGSGKSSWHPSGTPVAVLMLPLPSLREPVQNCASLARHNCSFGVYWPVGVSPLRAVGNPWKCRSTGFRIQICPVRPALRRCRPLCFWLKKCGLGSTNSGSHAEYHANLSTMLPERPAALDSDFASEIDRNFDRSPAATPDSPSRYCISIRTFASSAGLPEL